MAKYGKKNVIKDGIFDYNIGIIGESGIGKTTLAKEVCEKVVGEDGYIILNIGKEDGIDAIDGAVYADAPDWDTFSDICDDIVENKTTDYPNLKVVVIDTIDQLFEIGEPEVIRLHNIENRNKKDFAKCTSIKGAFGGFQGGEDKNIDIILEKLWELKSVGVHFLSIGHTKKRDIEDVVTGRTYSTLTTNMPQRYFNAIKTKLHLLGVISIDRNIIEEETGKEDVKTGKKKVKGKIVSESRKITFRDDNYTIDSKSRFPEIANEIPLDANAFINAVNDAIKNAKTKKDDTTIDLKDYDSPVGVLPTDSEDSISPEVEEDKIDGMKAEVKNKFREASKETKKLIKELLDGEKLSEINDEDKLKEILKTLEAAE